MHLYHIRTQGDFGNSVRFFEHANEQVLAFFPSAIIKLIQSIIDELMAQAKTSYTTLRHKDQMITIHFLL